MAKTAKLKKSAKPSTHSRASRRASSPALEGNLDKSLTDAPRPSNAKSQILAPQTGTGISKSTRKKGGKILKRKQKLRLEHGKEKAEAVNGKLEKKVARAEQMRVGKKGRNADWDDLNDKIAGRKKSKKEGLTKEDDAWEDEEMEVDGNGEVETVEENNVPNGGPIEETAHPKAIQVDTVEDVEDEIL